MIISSTEIGIWALLCACLVPACGSDPAPACFGLEAGKVYDVSVREIAPPEGIAGPSCGNQFDFWVSDELKFLITRHVEEESEGQSCAENIASWENPMSVELGITTHRNNASPGWHVLNSFAEVTKGECTGDWTAQVTSFAEDADPFAPYAAGAPVLLLYRQFVPHELNNCPSIPFGSFTGCLDRFGVEMSAE
jgi:hypothetical protein